MANIANDSTDVPPVLRPHITRGGWKDIAVHTAKEVMDDRVMLFAGGVTYFLLLALFPAVTAFVSIYGLFTDPGTVATQIAVLSAFVPPGGLTIIGDQMMRLSVQGAPTLGLTLLISLVVALWGASSGIKSMFEAMNVAYDETETRNFVKLNLLALVFTLASLAVAVVMLAVVVAIPVALSFVGFSEGYEWLIQIAGYAVMVAVLFAGLVALYRYGPCHHGEWPETIPGAVLALIAIGVVSALFSWYASSFGHFDQTYGSLGALIGFLFWLWVSVMAVIVGAELNSEIENERSSLKDSPSSGAHPLTKAGHDAAPHVSTASRIAHSPSFVAIAIALPLSIALTLLGRGRGR